jgi:hypothetical protein
VYTGSSGQAGSSQQRQRGPLADDIATRAVDALARLDAAHTAVDEGRFQEVGGLQVVPGGLQEMLPTCTAHAACAVACPGDQGVLRSAADAGPCPACGTWSCDRACKEAHADRAVWRVMQQGWPTYTGDYSAMACQDPTEQDPTRLTVMGQGCCCNTHELLTDDILCG